MRCLLRLDAVAVLLGATLFSTLAPEAVAQNRRRGGTQVYEHTRNTEKLRKVFAPVVATTWKSTVRIYCDDRQVALGTVVGSSGWIVTKASELKDDVEVRFGGGDGEVRRDAELVGLDDPNDLALLRVETSGLNKAILAIDNGTQTGSFVVTAAPDPVPLAYGVMSVARHPRKARTYLGVQSSEVPRGIRLTRIMPNTAAARAGLNSGDVVTVIGGKIAKDQETFREAILACEPGSDLRLEILRDGKKLEIVAKLKIDADRHGPISSQERSRLWGPLSDVRLGFEEVIQHDTVIRPNQCGGPLVNLKGEVVGINISRVGRFETVALTSRVVARSLARILADRE